MHRMADGSGPTLHAYLMVLRRRKWWVISLAMLGLAASLALSLTATKQYTATAQLLVQSSNQSVSLGSTAQQVTTTDVQTDLQLATSAPVIKAVSAKLGSAPAISTSEIAQTNVIALTAVSASPARAALIANTYANAFVEQTRNVALSNLTAAQTQLQNQINSIAQQIKSLQGQQSADSQVTALANQEAVLREEVAQLQINAAASTSGLEVVTPAQAPTSPSSPKPLQNALLGLAAGLVLGLGAAFLRDSLDDAVSSKDVAERFGNAPVLGLVPMVNSWRKRKRSMIAISDEPTSPAAEAYRSLRTSVQFVRQAQDLRMLLVTSPAADEGKTSTLANLGAVFAQAGERVVLVSCDLRRPRLGEILGIDEKLGLSDVLLGQQTLEEALQPVPGYDSLWILGAGPVPANPAELLNRPMARQVFAALRERFDLVLVDSPPVLPVTDAMVLSAHTDGALIVVAAGQTRRPQLQRTAERFAQAQAPVIGIVLNEVSKEDGYGSGYGYGYGYGSYGGYQSFQPDASLVSAPVQANGHPRTPPPVAGKGSHRAK
jgi:polysaccharide biosynthesis transport protein